MMDGGTPETFVGIRPEALTRLLPMAMVLSPSGAIRLAGPTLQRMNGDLPLAGADFFATFEILRPQKVTGIAELAALSGQRLDLQLRQAGSVAMRGLVLPLGPSGRQGMIAGAPDAGVIMNLGFGINAAEGVRVHGLTHADFAPTDLTVELLYLTEANAAVTAQLKALNGRLHDAHLHAARQALTDPLTGLGNRRAFDEALARAVAEARRGTPFALMHIDLDRFKAVNDTLGHAAGDHVIATVAAILRAETRLHECLARIGGDEFVVILKGVVDPIGIANLSRRIIGAIEVPIRCNEGFARISASIGVSHSLGREDLDPATMVAAADAATYASKRAGRGRVTIDVADPG